MLEWKRKKVNFLFNSQCVVYKQSDINVDCAIILIIEVMHVYRKKKIKIGKQVHVPEH